VAAAGLLGYSQSASSGQLRETPMHGTCYFDVLQFVNYFITVYDRPYKADDETFQPSAFVRTFGINALAMLSILFMMRSHDYYQKHFVPITQKHTGTVWDLFRVTTDMSVKSSGQACPFIEGTRTSMAEPVTFCIVYPEFVKFMLALVDDASMSPTGARVKDPSATWASQNDPKDISPILRAHASRVCLWVALSYNGHCWTWTYPGATYTGGIFPLYGFEKKVHLGLGAVCTPRSEAAPEDTRVSMRVPQNGIN